MKRWKFIWAILTMLLVMVVSIGCSTSAGGSRTANQQLFEARKGALSVSVSGTGNIEASEDAKLSFGVSGQIEEIYVEVGDEVSKGEVLAKLDTDTLGLAKTQAEIAVTETLLALTGAEVAQTQAEVAQTQAEVAQTQAEVALETAKFNLDRMENVQELKDDIEEAEWEVKIAEVRMKAGFAFGDELATNYWITQIAAAQLKILEYQEDLADLLAEDEYASLIVDEVKIKALQVKAAEQSLEQAKQTLKQTRQSVELAQQSVEKAKQSLQLAQQSLELAKKQLNKATITAPFDGVVAMVVAEEGDTVNSATQIIYLVNPTTMELVLKLDEMDVPGVMLNQKAIISVDALPSVSLDGRVISIYPTPTVVGGVVLYKTKISFNVPDDSGIKVGMSATADIVVSEANNVMLVPKQAIEKSEQGGTQVGVMVNGKIQKRPVVIGRSDGLYTEILSGVSEGESVIVNYAR